MQYNDTTLYSKCDQASDLWQQLELAAELKSDLWDNAYLWKWLVDFKASFNQSNNTCTTDMKMDGSVLEKNSSFKIMVLTFSLELDCGSYIISIAKTTPKKFSALIHSMKFLSPEVALYLYKSTIQPCME